MHLCLDIREFYLVFKKGWLSFRLLTKLPSCWKARMVLVDLPSYVCFHLQNDNHYIWAYLHISILPCVGGTARKKSTSHVSLSFRCTFLSLMPSCRTRVEWVIFSFQAIAKKILYNRRACIDSQSFFFIFFTSLILFSAKGKICQILNYIFIKKKHIPHSWEIITFGDTMPEMVGLCRIAQILYSY